MGNHQFNDPFFCNLDRFVLQAFCAHLCQGLWPIFIIIPIIGWFALIALGFIAFAVFVIEVIMVLATNDGRRMGDRMANTIVVLSD